MRRAAGGVVVALSIVLLAAQLGGLFGDETWAVQVAAAYCPPYVYVGLWTLAGVALLLVKARRALALVLLGLLVTLPYLDWGWGHNASGTRRVATFNVRAGTLGAEALGPLVQSVKPDVILLQECRVPLKGGPDPLPVILKSFPGWHSVRGGERGELAILSSKPITDVQKVKTGPGVTCLVARSHQVRWASYHLLAFGDKGTGRLGYLRSTAARRQEQVEALLRLKAQEDTAFVLAGDLNSTPVSLPLRTLCQELTDVRGPGLGLSFPARFPLWRIDYILASRHFSPGASAVVPTGASDHRMLWADLCPP